jgi:hypothetical protein
MAQQTAVEWFVEQLEEYGSDDFKIIFKKQFEQAKAMEKEHIELAYKNGINDEFEHWMNNQERITSLSYYKRAYKKK